MKTPKAYHYFTKRYPSKEVNLWDICQWWPEDDGTFSIHKVGFGQFNSKTAAQAKVDELNLNQHQDELLKAAGTQYFPYKDDHRLFINFLKVFIYNRRKNHKRLPWTDLGEVLKLQISKMTNVELAKIILDN